VNTARIRVSRVHAAERRLSLSAVASSTCVRYVLVHRLHKIRAGGLISLLLNCFFEGNHMNQIKRVTLISTLSALFVVLSGCHKSQVASTVPPPPPPAAPTASLTASPQAIEKGQTTTLTWETANANDVSIDAVGLKTETLGLLLPSGSLEVTPGDSTTYTLYAKGPGGSQMVSARVTVIVPEPPSAPADPSEDELFASRVKDIYFDFDTWAVRPDQQNSIRGDADFLAQHPNINITLEGNCDERGSTEYNLALGDKRASTVKELLVADGVSSTSIKTMSYGKEQPVCTEHDEACWQQNRHDHFSR